MLTCSCNFDYDFDYGRWLYDPIPLDKDFEIFCETRRKRCCSCNQLIDKGSLCVRYERKRFPYSEVEARIAIDYFDEEPRIRMASHFHCERCGEIFLNLWSLGYECLSPQENMEDSLKEYQEMTGFKKKA